MNMNNRTYKATDGRRGGRRRIKIRIAALAVIFLFFTSPLVGFAAEGNQPAPPNETILLKNGNWETAYWGDEGRTAYRYSGSNETTGTTPGNAFEITLAIDSPTLVRSVITVHSNDQNGSVTTLKSVIDGEANILDAVWPKTDGEVSITDEEGTVYGPFSCEIGSPTIVNGKVQPYVLWVADTGELELEPGRYTITGSQPETLIINNETNGQPAILVKGVDAGKWQKFLDNSGPARSFQGSYEVEVQDQYGYIAAEPVEFGMIDNGDSLEIVGMVADMPIDQSLSITSRSEDTIEAGGSVSLLPDQGLFNLSINTVIRLENDEWVFSGEWTLSQSMGGELQTSNSTFQGKMTGRDLPGFFFPKPAAGLGSLGNIPGPANEAQAVAGVVAPGLLALIASTLAGSGKMRGGSGGGGGAAMLMQPNGPIAPDCGGAGLDKPTFSSVTAEAAAPIMPQRHAVNTASFAQGIHTANSDVQQIQNMLGGQQTGGMNSVSESIQKVVGQVVDRSSGNMLNDVGIQVANDVATGGLGDLGFSGGDMLKAAARSIDADDVLSGTFAQAAALQFVSDGSKQLSLDILSPLLKPRTNLPEDLIKTIENSTFSI